MSHGIAPPIPTEASHIYDSYDTDPIWQRRFTIAWTAVLALCVVVSAPRAIKSVRQRWMLGSNLGVLGIVEDSDGYHPINDTIERPIPMRRNRHMFTLGRTFLSWLLFTPPYIGLNLGQLILIAGYFATVAVTVLINSKLRENANRAGFLAVAQLPPVFLFATKNSLLGILLGPGHGWEKVNWVHRWSGRGMALCAIVHGALWIRHNIAWNLTILGDDKEVTGIAAMSMLIVLTISSIKPIRAYCYQVFLVIHILSFPAFFIVLCYHTKFAAPWIYPPLAFYAFDLVLRLLKFRAKDALLVPVDQNMTLIRVANCDEGWVAGQHVRLSVFFNGRIFESHPLTIFNATRGITCLTADDDSNDLWLGARVAGDWTRDLNLYAREELDSPVIEKTNLSNSASRYAAFEHGVPVQVMIDGPYSGCSVNLGEYENVLLFAGGSGATFTLGLLDDIVGRCIKRGRITGERTRKIEFAWCIRSFASIEWFAPMLMDIANAAAGSSIDLHISVFVTCLCNPEAVPHIPNLDVTMERPSVETLLKDLVDHSTSPHSSLEKAGSSNSHGGVAVCASGPESLTRETANVVAKMGVTRGLELGGIALHTEVFAV